MSETAQPQTEPPKLRRMPDGGFDTSAFGDLLEWFLNFDERTARIRHPDTEELFQWKQQEDASRGVPTYPFANAEERFAVGVFQAIQENKSEPLLGLWINDLMAALHDSRTTKMEIAEANSLAEDPEMFSVQKAAKLTTNAEKRVYLTSCWLETLCTAEARVLGWIYQDLYGRPFTPTGP
ncbi:MAG: hypothetical protein H0V76_07320 [Blastocatellia bacterium]|nr:hypothetical protein [Blastocatellia bacterium]